MITVMMEHVSMIQLPAMIAITVLLIHANLYLDVSTPPEIAMIMMLALLMTVTTRLDV